MASPPFALSTTTPGDSDIVSQFPLDERNLRDVIQSWLLANHDTNGNHLLAIFPYTATTPTTPGASLTTVYASPTGRLIKLNPDASIEAVGNPSGTLIHWAGPGNTPPGYLIADGSGVSRSTYADLFTAIGTTYGVGDGTNTFQLPDLRGRVMAAVDNQGGNDNAQLTNSPSIASGRFSIGKSGGQSGHTLTLSEIPTGITSSNASQAFNLGVSVPSVALGNTIGNAQNISSSGATNAPVVNSGWGTFSSFSNPLAVTSNNTSGAGHENMPPVLLVRILIKT